MPEHIALERLFDSTFPPSDSLRRPSIEQSTLPSHSKSSVSIVASNDSREIAHWIWAFMPWLLEMSTAEVSIAQQTVSGSLHSGLLTVLPIAGP